LIVYKLIKLTLTGKWNQWLFILISELKKTYTDPKPFIVHSKILFFHFLKSKNTLLLFILVF